MKESLSFDRIARQYDETRGGEERGRATARFIAEHLVDGPVLEVGTGTGVVAAGLRDFGHPVLGLDISAEMLVQAYERLDGAAILGDAQRLPLPDGVVPNVICVHVLHLVGDMDLAIAEAARVMRPGGRLVAFHGNLEGEPDDIIEAMTPLDELRERPDTVDGVARAGKAAGLQVLIQSAMGPFDKPFAPSDFVRGLQEQQYPYLWGLDAATRQRVVEPVIAALRALPDQDRRRPQRWRAPFSVLSKES